MGGANDIVVYIYIILCYTVIPTLKSAIFLSSKMAGTVPDTKEKRCQPSWFLGASNSVVWLQDHVYTQALHVGYIYLQNWMIFRVNVGRHTIQHLG